MNNKLLTSLLTLALTSSAHAFCVQNNLDHQPVYWHYGFWFAKCHSIKNKGFTNAKTTTCTKINPKQDESKLYTLVSICRKLDNGKRKFMCRVRVKKDNDGLVIIQEKNDCLPRES